MQLKVIKYRDSGMISHDYVENDYWHKHTYCSFELSNRKVIVCIYTFHNFANDCGRGENEYHYINSLNDKFESSFLSKSEKVSIQEIDIIEDFYHNASHLD